MLWEASVLDPDEASFLVFRSFKIMNGYIGNTLS
jgi:hypothetical protein